MSRNGGDAFGESRVLGGYAVQATVDLLDGLFSNLALGLEAGDCIVLTVFHDGAQLVVEVVQRCDVENTGVDVHAVYDDIHHFSRLGVLGDLPWSNLHSPVSCLLLVWVLCFLEVPLSG